MKQERPKSYFVDDSLGLRFRFCDIAYTSNFGNEGKSSFRVTLKSGDKINFSRERAEKILNGYDEWFDFLDNISFNSVGAAPEMGVS